MRKNIIGIDIGATKIVFVEVRLKSDTSLTPKKVVRVKTPKNRKEFLKVVVNNIKKLKSARQIEGVGVGIAGVLDKKREKVLFSPNLKFLENFPLRKALEKETSLRVFMENDVNCFTLAEAVLGAGKGKKIVFGITLGSGVGGGLVINNKIYRGAFGGAGEIGHTTIKFDGPKDACGNLGCFEVYGSKKFFEMKKVDSIETEKKADKGDKKAKEIFKEYGKNIGIGLANLVNLLEPEVVVIGGGISRASKHFLKIAEFEARKRIVSPVAKKNFKIKLGKLGNSAVALGARLLIE